MLASIRALLAEIIDYAGLFPPAQLDLPEAIANYAHYQTSPERWLLGRFILPVSQLPKFAAIISESSLEQWPLSLILSGNWQQELVQVRSLMNPQILISALEFPCLSLQEISQVLPHLPTAPESFFEIPFNVDLHPYCAVLAGTGSAAKIRTGGVTAKAFPDAEQLAARIIAFAQAGVPFKATAGLHHPLPGQHRLTYEPKSPLALMPGFLNVAFLAALASQQKVKLEEATMILTASSLQGFQASEVQIGWHNHYMSTVEIEVARRCCFRSFGSCSFAEPVHDLKELQLL